MFYESKYPKKKLISISKQLVSFKKRFLLHENWLFKLEELIFIGFYYCRKLMESRFKVTDSVKKSIIVNKYKFIGKKTLMWPIWVWDEYDFENPIEQKMKIQKICNLLIHSQIFYPRKDKKWLRSIFFTSDHDLYDHIYEVDIKYLIYIFEEFWKNTVQESRIFKDKNWKIVIINA